MYVRFEDNQCEFCLTCLWLYKKNGDSRCELAEQHIPSRRLSCDAGFENTTRTHNKKCSQNHFWHGTLVVLEHDFPAALALSSITTLSFSDTITAIHPQFTSRLKPQFLNRV